MSKYPTSPTPSVTTTSQFGFARSPPLSHNSPTQFSPLPSPLGYNPGCLSAAAKRWKYLKRLINFRQMDFQFAMWQMIYLFLSPQKVYKNFFYRKQSKAQFARDDPAFLVLLSGWLFVSSVVFAVAMSLSFTGFIKFLLYTVFVDCLFAGCVMTTILWFYSNRWLVKSSPNNSRLRADFDEVEWGFAFDVHLNAFFPSLVLLHVLQLFFYPVLISGNGFFATLVGNSFWILSVSYYIYITTLGYSSLPFLHNTRSLLYPLPFLFIVYIVSLCIQWNVTHTWVEFYLYRLHML